MILIKKILKIIMFRHYVSLLNSLSQEIVYTNLPQTESLRGKEFVNFSKFLLSVKNFLLFKGNVLMKICKKLVENIIV